MSSQYRRPSPSRSRKKPRDDPHRMSTGSLAGGGDGYYGGPPPVAPQAPPQNNHSVPQSPISSNESIGAYPPGSRLGHMHHHPLQYGFPPAPAPPAMRGGDAGYAYNGARPNYGKNAQTGNTQNVIHQKYPQHTQEYEHPESDYRNHPRAHQTAHQTAHQAAHQTAHRESRSSSSTRDGEFSPPGSAGGFESQDRHRGFAVPSGQRQDRGYRLDGPLPGERDQRSFGGTVYNPASGNRPVLGGERQRGRSSSRGPHGLGLGEIGGDGQSDGYSDERDMYDQRPGGRRPAGSGIAGPNAGALVRSRSRSAPPESRAMIPQHAPFSESDGGSSSSSSSTVPQPGTGIRLEYAGNSVDITYTGSGGKPVSIGSITINTTARTTAIPINPATQAITAPQMQAITAPPSAPAPAALPAPPPPPVQPVFIPPPPAPVAVPPPGIEPLILPPPPAPMIPASMPASVPVSMPVSMPRQDMGTYGGDERGMRDHMFHSMDALALEPRYDDRGRDREIVPLRGVRALSRRRRSQSRGRKPADDELRWTKISRDIVARRAVEVRGYDFEEQPDSIVVFRVLNEDEIDDLIGLSERIRKGEIRVIRRDRRDDSGKERDHRRRRPHPRQRSHSRPQSVHGYPISGGPGPSANRPPPAKPALVIPAPDPPQAEAPAPPPQPSAESSGARGGRPTEDPNKPGTYIGYSRNPPRSAADSGPY
ncbi:unnamed protein product [Tuber aestivum]|uniref:DUF8035 domain-containing protein n=1 Tax=Tuber aestivum TaxID=59557 RepID=A0A292Q7E8_9PEZI|nr:unnamed protein product [Tuber aestivum]